MADEPISALTLFTSYSTADEVEILDVSDTTFASTGTNKRIQFSTLLTMAGVGTVAGGGTGLRAVGSADQLLGVAHTGGALEYKTLNAGSNITITPAAGSITIAASGGGGGSGTVTSVGLSLPPFITVTGPPVSTSGTLTGTLATQTANTHFAGPTSGSAAAPTFRALVPADLPTTGLVITQHSCVIGSSSTNTPSWTHVQSTGAQTTGGSNLTLTMTFPNAVHAGDMIAVGLVWLPGTTAIPTIADNKNSGNYTYAGPSTITTGNITVGIWYYPASVFVAADTLVVTATTPAGSFGLGLSGDEFTYAGGLSVDSSNQTSQAGSTSITTALTVAGSPAVDMVYAVVGSGTYAVTGSPGSGFTATYNEATISEQAYGIMAEYDYPVTSNISATASSTEASLEYIAAVAFKLTPAMVINWASADFFIPGALSAVSTAIMFTNVTVGQRIRLILQQSSSGGNGVVWPTGISGGSAWPPTLSGAGLRDEVAIECIAANTYIGYVILQGF